MRSAFSWTWAWRLEGDPTHDALLLGCRLHVSPASKRTPPGRLTVTDDNLDGPTSAVCPVVPLFAVPWLAVSLEGLRLLPLDARAAYLLSLVDGHCTVETILDICEPELTREDAQEVFAHLMQLGAIELHDP